MTTANITTTTEGTLQCDALPDAVFQRPIPAQIDAFIIQYKLAKSDADATREVADSIKERLIHLIDHFGHPLPNSERSWLIEGALNDATLTRGTTITVNDAAVCELFELLDKALGASTAATVFSQLFIERRKYELAPGAENAIRTINLPKRLLQKVQAAYGLCYSQKDKAPALKITSRNKQKPVRKPRAKKAVAA